MLRPQLGKLQLSSLKVASTHMLGIAHYALGLGTSDTFINLLQAAAVPSTHCLAHCITILQCTARVTINLGCPTSLIRTLKTSLRNITTSLVPDYPCDVLQVITISLITVADRSQDKHSRYSTVLEYTCETNFYRHVLFSTVTK